MEYEIITKFDDNPMELGDVFDADSLYFATTEDVLLFYKKDSKDFIRMYNFYKRDIVAIIVRNSGMTEITLDNYLKHEEALNEHKTIIFTGNDTPSRFFVYNPKEIKIDLFDDENFIIVKKNKAYQQIIGYYNKLYVQKIIFPKVKNNDS